MTDDDARRADEARQAEADDAFAAGRQACRQGLGCATIPYRDQELRDAWYQGHRHEQRAREAEERGQTWVIDGAGCEHAARLIGPWSPGGCGSLRTVCGMDLPQYSGPRLALPPGKLVSCCRCSKKLTKLS